MIDTNDMDATYMAYEKFAVKLLKDIPTNDPNYLVTKERLNQVQEMVSLHRSREIVVDYKKIRKVS